MLNTPRSETKISGPKQERQKIEIEPQTWVLDLSGLDCQLFFSTSI